MEQKKPFPWVAVILGVGCVGMLCVGVLVVGGGAVFLWLQPVSSVSEPLKVQPTSETSPYVAETSFAPIPTDSGPRLTGSQYIDDYSLFDNFSSDVLGWPVYDDGNTIMQYENGTYSIQIAEPEYIDWAYIPVGFVPYEIWFDVQGEPGEQDGTFGVLCQYQDVDNHYYVEFDLESNSYIIAQYLNGEDIPLTKQNTVGQFWYETDAFDSSPTAVNNIGVGCYLDMISLFINGQFVDEVSILNPLGQPGEAAFFVYAFSYADENGYKIFIDNVNVYQPMQ